MPAKFIFLKKSSSKCPERSEITGDGLLIEKVLIYKKFFSFMI